MNRLFIPLFAGMLALCGCAPRCEMTVGEFAPGIPEYVFTNGLLEIKVVPHVAGRIHGLTYLPAGFALFEPMKYEVKTHDLLPPQIVSPVTGGRELIWGVSNFFNEKMAVARTAAGPEWTGIVMHGRYFQGENFDAVKKVTTAAGTLKVDIEFTIINRERRPRSVALWKHLTAQMTPGVRDVILIPTRGGVARVAGKAVLELSEDAIYRDFAPEHQAFFAAPLASWIGRCSSDGVNRGTLVMSCDEMLSPEARFYCWKDPAKTLHTAEMILPERTLAPSNGHTASFSYCYFPHLRSLRALSRDTGFDLEPGALTLECAVPSPARTLELTRTDGGRREPLGQFTIPALKAGIPHRIALPAAATGPDASLIGEWDDGTTFIMPKIKESGKK